MRIILVPGLWLDAASWDDVLPLLRSAAHDPHPLTMPGVGEPAETSRAIGIAEWIGAVVDAIDETDGPVALVGHSGGGNVIAGAAEARADRVARLLYLDTLPPADGDDIWSFPVVDGVVPFPGWEHFEEAEVADLDPATRTERAARALSVPARVPSDAIALPGRRRHDIPTTVIMTSYPGPTLRADMAAGVEWTAELARIGDLEIVGFEAGHWPQFSAPDAVAEAIVSALAG